MSESGGLYFGLGWQMEWTYARDDGTHFECGLFGDVLIGGVVCCCIVNVGVRKVRLLVCVCDGLFCWFAWLMMDSKISVGRRGIYIRGPA